MSQGSAVAVLSMLHESAQGSAARLFRGRPVLRWTLDRLARCGRLASVAVLCREDQAEAARAAAEGSGARVLTNGARACDRASVGSALRTVPVRASESVRDADPTQIAPRHLVKTVAELPRGVEAVAAARRWSDGWRGGLLGTCSFDAGFFAPWVLEAATFESETAGSAPKTVHEQAGPTPGAIVLVDPSAGLVDPALIDGLIEHANAQPDEELCFAPAAPGLSGVLLKRPLLERLAAAGGAAGTHPGRLLHYHPAQLSREMLASAACAPVPTPVARTTHSFTLSSDRRIRRMEAATAELNGQLRGAGAERLVQLAHRLQEADPVAASDALPREVVLELNTNRATRPIFWPGRYNEIRRMSFPLQRARRLFDEMAALDDTRLTLAGVGDPLLAESVFEIIAAAVAAGVTVNIETDFIGVDVAALEALVDSRPDVVSVHLPSVTAATYTAVMGVDGYREALGNIESFVKARAARDSALPLLAPLFVKCGSNLGEMEAWYDQWLGAVGSAVVLGPGDYAGLMPDIAVADMAPPRRRACARLVSRVTILSDGRIVSCEQDVLGRQVLGQLGVDSLGDVWRGPLAALRGLHARGDWNQRPACAACREWHRG